MLTQCLKAHQHYFDLMSVIIKHNTTDNFPLNVKPKYFDKHITTLNDVSRHYHLV